MKKIPRLVISAGQGHSGKTTVTLGLLQALKKRGIKVQPFKKGPDYIDPSWHTLAAGVKCRNLDAFMMDKYCLTSSFFNNSQDKDLSIVEGAMGLYDGLDIEGSGSTAEIAYMLDAPVILVVSCLRMTRSVAAFINGFVNFDSRIKIGGIILNNVARKRHKDILTKAIEKYCDIPIVGIIPKSKEVVIPGRHLGLVPATEIDALKEKVDRLGEIIAENVDLDLLLEIANQAPSMSETNTEILHKKSEKVKIGVFKDRVFSFYYPENLEALIERGAELIYINSLTDEELPNVDALYIGGGFPDVFAEDLEKNKKLREKIKIAIINDMPVYAECGGLVYLGRRIFLNGKSFDMVGALPYDVSIEEKPQGHGYTINKVINNNPFLPLGLEVKGHEFHNSRVINLASDNIAFSLQVERGKGINGVNDGLVYKNCFATYNYIHSIGVPEWAEGMIKRALVYKQSNLNKGNLSTK